MNKTLILILLFTISSLGYIHQQVEFVKLSYDIGLREGELRETLDQNTVLRYNISKFKTPGTLKLVLMARDEDMVFSTKDNFIAIARNNTLTEEKNPQKTVAQSNNPIFSLFTAATAEAEDLK